MNFELTWETAGFAFAFWRHVARAAAEKASGVKHAAGVLVRSS